MTKREFLTAIATMETVDAEIKEFAEKEIHALDARNAKRLTTPTKKQIENEELKNKILDMFKGQEEVIARTIAEKMEITTSKASALCRQLVAEEKISVTNVIGEKSRLVKGYTFQ